MQQANHLANFSYGPLRVAVKGEGEPLSYPYWLTRNRVALGNVSDALGYAGTAYSLSPWNTEAVGGLAGLLLRTGDSNRARELLGRLGDGKARNGFA